MWSRDLPENLVVEILSRSPVKSLMRFKSVRKSWHAYLRNHSFITQHHKWATSDNQGRGVVFTHEHQGQTHVALLSNDTLEMSRDIELVILPREVWQATNWWSIHVMEYFFYMVRPWSVYFFLYGTSLGVFIWWGDIVVEPCHKRIKVASHNKATLAL